jgi:competence protein ComGC
MVKSSQKGITLVGCMIVLGVISLLVSFIVPQRIWARHRLNEQIAIQTLQLYSTQLQQFHSIPGNGKYPMTLKVVTDDFIDQRQDGIDWERGGYRFIYHRTSPQTFVMYGIPKKSGISGTRRFYVDQTGVVRSNLKGLAGPTSGSVSEK